MSSSTRSPIEQRSLREQVYDHLRESLANGVLRPGDPIDLGSLERELGISRTPLREALLRLEIEGFVTILPRRGVLVRPLDLESIRKLYQIIGGLESAGVIASAPKIGPEEIGTMRSHNAVMREALGDDDFDRYYEHNMALHALPIELTANPELARLIDVFRQRLYDFPRKPGFIKDWEIDSTAEHGHYIDLLENGDARGAAEFIRDVHWSFDIQREHILRYYADELDGQRGD